MHTFRFPLAGLALAAMLGVVRAADAPSEKNLLAALKTGAPAEKALTCKQLAVYGSSAAVPELAKLLSDEQLASWSRIALEAIPGNAAAEALRNATYTLEGKLLVGVINSIGVRRDAGSVEPLIARLRDPDAEVASAAAVALGRIGNAAAAKPLREALTTAPAKVRSAVAEGCILCAEQYLAAGNSAEATAIYDAVRKADVPRPRIIEATRGAILARNQQGIPLLLEQLRSPDKALFQIGLSTAREFPGGEVDQALAAELDRAAPERAPLVLLAMADRPQTVVLPAVLKAAGKGPQPLRLAALAALGRIGNTTCLDPLLAIAVEPNVEVAQSAKAALASLPDENVNQQIAARLANAQGKAYPVLIELVGQRRVDAVPALVKALDHSDTAVRSAALASLGNTVSAQDLAVLISQVVSPRHAEDAPAAQKALKTAAVRMPDREACAAQLTAALDGTSAETKSLLLETLGQVGGTKALAAVGAAAKSNDPQLQDLGSRLLGEWMTIDAAPVLLNLARTESKYQNRALRGYIRIARQFTMDEPQRVVMCQQAFEASKQPAEQKLVLEVLKRYPSVGTLRISAQAAQVPELKEDAKAAAQAIASKLPKTDEVKQLLSQAGASK